MSEDDRYTAGFRYALLSMVSIVWGISFLADILPTLDYQPTIWVHLAFMVVLGVVFGRKSIDGFIGRDRR